MLGLVGMAMVVMPCLALSVLLFVVLKLPRGMFVLVLVLLLLLLLLCAAGPAVAAPSTRTLPP